MLLGSQSLISFRERITCVNDEVVVGDSVREENTEAHVPMKVKLLIYGYWKLVSMNVFYSVYLHRGCSFLATHFIVIFEI